jgi:hypothetical protein
MAHSQPRDTASIRKPPPSNGSAVAALVLGVFAIVTGVWAPVPVLGILASTVAFVPAALAVIFGHVGLNNARKTGGAGRGMSLTGLWTGYITLAIIVLMTFGSMLLVTITGSSPLG